ncbi:hypothetical protein WMY93_028772 [Mugilogobius chulae]|uniref:Uncharacterized protein n=1 Tax=Mugilogobius chulae TaxID=88201 RepID=A0AAW0MVZ6_9GOBI
MQMRAKVVSVAIDLTAPQHGTLTGTVTLVTQSPTSPIRADRAGLGGGGPPPTCLRVNHVPGIHTPVYCQIPSPSVRLHGNRRRGKKGGRRGEAERGEEEI